MLSGNRWIIVLMILVCSSYPSLCYEGGVVQSTPEFLGNGNSWSSGYECPETKYYNRYLSNSIARDLLDFARNVHGVLEPPMNSRFFQNMIIFSPVSLLSAVVVIMMGSAGRTYQQFQEQLKIHTEEETIVFHEEFSKMLADLQHPRTIRAHEREQCSTTRWKTTNSNVGIGNDHVIHMANGIFIRHDYRINPVYR